MILESTIIIPDTPIPSAVLSIAPKLPGFSMFSKINNIFGSRLCGIDFISTDITKSYKDGYGSIIELNAGAHELIHYQNEFVSKEEFFV